MILYHITHRARLRSIMRHGLRCQYSQGRVACVWLAARGQRDWALRHVGIDRGYRLADIVCLRVSVPAASVRRRRPGIYTSRRDVPATAIKGIDTVAFTPLIKGVRR